MIPLSKHVYFVLVIFTTMFSANAMAESRPLVFTGYMEEDNLPVEGPQDLTLTLYDDSTSVSNDNVLWNESTTLLFIEGEFTVQLGANAANPLPDVLHQTDSLYLGIQVGDDDEMSPRLSVAAVPFSKHAERADQVGSYDADALNSLNEQLQIAKDGLADLVVTLEGHDLDDIESDIQIQVNNLNLLSDTIDAVEAAAQLRVSGSCLEGQSIRAIAENGSVTCEADDNTQLDESAVDAYVSNNGYAQITQLFSGSFTDLSNVPNGLADGDDNTQLDESAVDAYVSNNGYAQITELFSGSFDDLSDVPSDLADGDDNTTYTAANNGGLSIDNSQAIGLISICGENQLLKFDGIGWECRDDIDTRLSESEVDAFVSNNGFAQASQLFSGSFTDLDNIPSGLADGDDNTQLSEAQVDGFVSNNGFAQASQLFSGSFTDLSNVPSGLADGDDNTQLSEAQVDDFVSNNGFAQASQLFSGSYDDLSNTPSFTGWDTNASDDFSGDFGDLANIPDDLADGDHNNIYVAGDGLMVVPDMNSNDNQSTLAVDTSVIQNRITGSCPAGQSIRAIDANGNVTCETDTDTNTTYDGTSFALSNQSCGAGEVMKGINSNGTPNCVADQNTDSDTTYDGTNFALSNQNCGAGEVMKGVNSNGTPNCVNNSTSNGPIGRGIQFFTSDGTFVVPDNVSKLKLTVVGGGSGGACGDYDDGVDGSDGHNGGVSIKYLDVTAATSYSVTVGTGGPTGNANDGQTGAPGGASSFDSISATGGTASNDGTGSGGDLNATGNLWFGPAHGEGGHGNRDTCSAGTDGFVMVEW